MAFSLKTFKGLAADATTALSRAKQYTEEKLGYTERTELDGHFDAVADKADKTKKWTEKIVANTEAVLQPNPNTRVEDYLFERLDKRREQERMRNLEWLGGDMIDAGVEFGPDTVYGSALVKVGQTQQRLGATEREFVGSAYSGFVRPMKKFLDEDMKAITRERKTLEAKRLDLDAAKTRLRKAKTAETQVNAERDISVCQDEFNRRVELTRKSMEGINSAHASHVKHLSDFVESQIVFYATSHQHMCDLQRELASLKLSSATGGLNLVESSNKSNLLSAADLTSPTDEMPKSLPSGKKRARVLFDYEARNSTELSLIANEVLIVANSKELEADWLMGERGNQKGKVPLAYLELLN